jgi:hypothetical protein
VQVYGLAQAGHAGVWGPDGGYSVRDGAIGFIGFLSGPVQVARQMLLQVATGDISQLTYIEPSDVRRIK